MMRVWGVGALIAFAAAGPPTYADECIQPRNARVFASASGDYILRVGQKQAERASFSFSADDPSLVITLDWGQVIRIDLSSGKIS
jgi:hypothetical protein